jgi:uncharacterized membrane protein
MEVSETLSVVFRWLHIAAGILWIGLLYFFNFVNAPFAPTMDGETKKKVVPELIPRALYWFRWGAAYTWITGILLLLLVFYHGGLMFDQGVEWGAGSTVMLVVVFLVAFLLYDLLAKSAIGKNLKVFALVGFLLVAVTVYCMIHVGMFSYRAYVIHTGAMFGTIMAANVWMRIWPAQKKIIAAIRNGTSPDQALVAMAGGRSKHNTYLSVPLVWMMIDAHTVVPASSSWWYLLGAVLVGWMTVALIYGKAMKVKGM